MSVAHWIQIPGPWLAAGAEAANRAMLGGRVARGLVEGAEATRAGLVCERNAQDRNRLDWLMGPDLVNQFRVAGAKIQFVL